MDTRLKASLNGNATLTDVDIAQWAKSDPYFVVPKVLLLTDGEKPDAESRRRLIAQLAIAVGDREELGFKVFKGRKFFVVTDLFDEEDFRFFIIKVARKA